MRVIVETLTAAAEEALHDLHSQGVISMQSVESSSTSKATDFKTARNALGGILTKEEGEELIRQIRHDRDHDWE